MTEKRIPPGTRLWGRNRFADGLWCRSSPCYRVDVPAVPRPSTKEGSASVIGTTLAHYAILSRIGAGGMGEVYRAKDLRLGREVAVKVLPAELAASPERLARLEREARTVAGLNHPNIVTLFSVEDEEGVRFLTMELVEGQTLSTLVTPGGLPLPRILELAIPLTDALVAAHAKGVIHRDLKPGNVMVTQEGRVKVLDFGLAKMAGAGEGVSEQTVSATASAPVSGEGQVVGTVPYMAPEQLRGEPVDARSDLFSLGTMLYELASGRRPFRGPTNVEVSSAILRDTPEPLGRVRSDLPADLVRVVSRCLEKSPEKRFQGALEVNDELRRLRKVLERGERWERATDQVASIAVLPFANRSRDEEDEYFSDGLADELLNVLAKIKGLRVTARTSSFQFKGATDDIATIGSKLDVASILEGSVRKAGKRIRVSVQLVRVSDASHMWSETYDRALDDIFAVQDDITQSVVKELRAALLGEEAGSDAGREAEAEVAQAARGRATDPEAHRLYLQARYLVDRHNREDLARAIDYLNEALAIDTNFALAWAMLSQAHASRANFAWAPYAEAYPKARDAAERALALEPDLAEAHAQLAAVLTSHYSDLQGAKASYARALELAPRNPEVLSYASKLEWDLGHLEEAIALCRRALERDPLSSTTYNRLGLALHHADRFAEAEAAFRKALELAPRRGGTHAFLSFPLLALGRGEEALVEAGAEPADFARLWSLAIVHHGMGHEEESDRALRQLIANHGSHAATQIADVYGARGDADEVFEWLERGYEQQDPGLSEITHSPHLRSLHGDPRWSAFLKKRGLEG
jgi:serine/threonine protein kinase/Tfp pilus assembly protein PilF